MENRILFALLALLVGAVPALAAEQTETLKIAGHDVQFSHFEDRHITISSSCVKSGKLGACDASRAISKADSSKLTQDILGRNPGAMLCSTQLNGTVVWSKDAKGNERTFCQFKDGSMLGSGTLAYYGARQSK